MIHIRHMKGKFHYNKFNNFSTIFFYSMEVCKRINNIFGNYNLFKKMREHFSNYQTFLLRG